MKFVFFSILTLIFVGCFEENAEQKNIDLTKFKKDTDLMINICEKLSHENDAGKLHKVAVATQTSRVVNCTDVAGECSLYLEFLSTAIKSSEDGDLSEIESVDLQERVKQLREAIEKAKIKIRKLSH